MNLIFFCLVVGLGHCAYEGSPKGVDSVYEDLKSLNVRVTAIDDTKLYRVEIYKFDDFKSMAHNWFGKVDDLELLTHTENIGELVIIDRRCSITSELLIRIVEANISLEKLQIHYVTEVDDQLLSAIGNLHSLKNIRLETYGDVGDIGILREH